MNTRIQNLTEMLREEPKDVFLNYALAIEFAGSEKYEEAEQQFLKTTQLNPEYLPCYYQLGQIAEKIKTEKEALEYYKKGLALAQQQNNPKAINELNEVIWMLEDN